MRSGTVDNLTRARMNVVDRGDWLAAAGRRFAEDVTIQS